MCGRAVPPAGGGVGDVSGGFTKTEVEGEGRVGEGRGNSHGAVKEEHHAADEEEAACFIRPRQHCACTAPFCPYLARFARHLEKQGRVDEGGVTSAGARAGD